ncbi:hypothetical protein EI983_11565 [Roseovarius faecimaris]|uniref:DUF4398 domain-containing protein n=1 Tax=Roseovarius faecimaris TaxID=2494550 RepID=A0A6I6IRY6_9RHOB|nr:hypothetical protein [Roseovarius faecimaris]QGX98874.1 hypothetical protein EI983_11565 [Roseovarius faecimaris]
MLTSRVQMAGLTALLLSACAQSGQAPEIATRLHSPALHFEHDPVAQAVLADQLVAMQDSAARLAGDARRGDADLAASLEAASARYAQFSETLPRALAMQQARKATLTARLAQGEISLAEHDRGVETLRQERRDLAAALTLSARDVRRANRALRASAAKGGTGLETQIEHSETLARAMAADKAALPRL